MRRVRQWEHWEIPLGPVARANDGKIRLRFLTDSYTRAQERSAPTWKWALWGQPQIVRIGRNGHREIVYDFVENLEKARAFTRLDFDGREYPFDAGPEDSTGATFKVLGPDSMGRLMAKLQDDRRDLAWVSGFKKWGESAPHQGAYTSYLGEVESRWSYGGESEVTWETETVPREKRAGVVFVGSTDFTPAKAELRVENQPVIRFDTGIPASRSWTENGWELRYLHAAEIPNRGISGVYILELPASKVSADRLRLSLRIPTKAGGWVMCHGYANTLQTVRQQMQGPNPAIPAIAAFTPHKNDKFGITIAEYVVTLPPRVSG
jgi:hypothetical protein